MVAPIQAHVNMGLAEPLHRTGCLLLYSRNQLTDVTSKFDE